MNKVILIGNLTRDPEKRTTAQGTSVTTFTLAVNRKFKNDDGTYDADFINCVAWRQTADFIAQYFQKGSRIAVTGTIQTRSYQDKNGNSRYATEVIVDEAEFTGSKTDQKPGLETAPKETPKKDPIQETFDEFVDYEPDENELPF